MEDLQPEDKPQYKIYVDMDGVLADFTKGIDKLMPGDYDHNKYQTDGKYRSKMWKAVKDYSKEGGRLWAELELMPDAKQLWNYVKKHNPEILTASGNPKFGAPEQKKEWVPKKLGNVKTNIVEHSSDKAQYATPDSILIDDQPKSIGPWIAAGGIGILHTSAANTIKELKKLGL